MYAIPWCLSWAVRGRLSTDSTLICLYPYTVCFPSMLCILCDTGYTTSGNVCLQWAWRERVDQYFVFSELQTDMNRSLKARNSRAKLSGDVTVWKTPSDEPKISSKQFTNNHLTVFRKNSDISFVFRIQSNPDVKETTFAADFLRHLFKVRRRGSM